MTHPLDEEDAAVLSTLGARSPSESLPLMLEIARQQAARRRPADLVAQMGRDLFVPPSALDLRTVHRFDGLALEAASEHEAVLLSPLTPLGCCSVVSPTNQDRALATVRGTEVVSDPTNVMALECARRLAKAPATDVRLCTLHQVVRPQRFEAGKGYTQHFRMFALAEAGPARAEHAFEVDSVLRHIRVLMRFVDTCSAHGCSFGERKLRLLVGPAATAKAIGDRLRPRLATAAPGVTIEDAALDSTYYDGIRVLFDVATSGGAMVQLADVGVFDWVAKLTSNRRMRLVAAGLGIQLIPQLFRA